MILRPATEDDLELLMAWRSHPEVYKGFYQQERPLEWEEHLNWFRSRNQDWRTLIIEYSGRKVGVVTIGQLDHWSPEIGYYIGEISLWGRGVGKAAVQEALNYIKGLNRKHIVAVHTTVLKDNTRSLRLLQSLGFRIGDEAREGEVWLHRRI